MKRVVRVTLSAAAFAMLFGFSVEARDLGSLDQVMIHPGSEVTVRRVSELLDTIVTMVPQTIYYSAKG